MKEVIVRLTSDYIKVKGGEYVRDYDPNEADRAYYVGWTNGEKAERSRHKPKRGKWIDWLGKGNEWECSVCKCSIESHGSIAYNFCPMCGADMREVRDE